MKHISYILFSWTLLLMSFASANGQKLSDTELQAFLTAAANKTSEYSNVFKNLTVEEIKTFETFDNDGKMKSRRKILSDLIIYESATGEGRLGEFRNVREVNTQKIKNSEKRTVKIFAEPTNARRKTGYETCSERSINNGLSNNSAMKKAVKHRV